jgi:hypothetical protein
MEKIPKWTNPLLLEKVIVRSQRSKVERYSSKINGLCIGKLNLL